jgi:enamine deaminase RidA (YjgF/YER057c/UK114 family)
MWNARSHPFIAGQLGYDAAGKQGSDFRTQTTLVFENLKAVVESAGGHMDNIVKLNTYLTEHPCPTSDRPRNPR